MSGRELGTIITSSLIMRAVIVVTSRTVLLRLTVYPFFTLIVGMSGRWGWHTVERFPISRRRRSPVLLILILTGLGVIMSRMRIRMRRGNSVSGRRSHQG
jgi:hypothetical protein